MMLTLLNAARSGVASSRAAAAPQRHRATNGRARITANYIFIRRLYH